RCRRGCGPRRTRACPFAPPCQRSRTGSCRAFGSGAARCLGRLRCLDADSASECPELLLLLEGGEPLLEELERRRARILRQRPELSCQLRMQRAPGLAIVFAKEEEGASNCFRRLVVR